MEKQRTLVLIKPDAIERALIGRIIARFEDRGLQIIGMKMMCLNTNLLEKHYAHLKDKSFFPDLVKFMTSAPVIVLCIEGVDGVNVVRNMCGITNSREAAPGTIRGDLGMSMRANLVHASDSIQSAAQEIERFFSQDELFSHNRVLDNIIYVDR